MGKKRGRSIQPHPFQKIWKRFRPSLAAFVSDSSTDSFPETLIRLMTKKMEQGEASRYWCHVCSQTVSPIETMKCPNCENCFVEEATNETPLNLDLRASDSDRSLSLWAPILLGMMIHRHPVRQMEPEGDNHDSNPNHEHDSMITRRRSTSALLQILQRIRSGTMRLSPNLDNYNHQQRDQDRMILINRFSLSDYFNGPGLDLLIQNLSENDGNRHGTPPARKEAVEGLRRVVVEEVEVQCAVCLEECEVGGEVKEMPCMHKFHGTCIGAWLRLHSSCPVCRYQMPVDECGNGRRLLLPASPSHN